MSILIRGMELPTKCSECNFCVNGFTDEAPVWECACEATKTSTSLVDDRGKPFDFRPDWCPLVEVQEPHWIPCKERFPKEERKAYWCCDESGYQFQARWTNNTLGICESDRWGWSICDVPQYSHVIAWMPLPPLPPPYTAEGSEE